MEKIFEKIDEIVIPEPTDVTIDIENNKEKNREVKIHGSLVDGNRFQIVFRGNFGIQYEIYDKKKKERKTVYKECSK